MTKFLQKILIFVIPIVLFIGMIFPVDSMILHQRLKQQESIIVAGDSRLECSVDPSLYKGINNISQSGETYFYTYYKLKLIFQIYKPETVVISLAPSNLTFFQDQKTFALDGNERYKSIVPAYAFVLGKDGVHALEAKMPDETKFIPLLSNSFSVALKENIQGRNSYIGEYREITESHLNVNHVHQRANLHFTHASGSVQAESGFSEEYLGRIATLCRENNVELVLLTTPVHPTYEEMIPRRFQLLKENVQQSFKAKGLATILDYSGLDLADDYFADGDHLNTLGSRVITEMLLNDLQK